MARCNECTLGGHQFDAVAATDAPKNYGSTNNRGRTGASNFWGNWPRRGSAAGITARAPYNIGDPKTKPSLGGQGRHLSGLGLGAHGHGIGVVPASFGGPHNPRSGELVREGKGGDFSFSLSGGFCPKCFGTWLLIGAAVVLILIVGGR
jgi:hypothetical protein